MSKRTSTHQPQRKAAIRFRSDTYYFFVHRGQIVFQSSDLTESMKHQIGLRGARLCVLMPDSKAIKKRESDDAPRNQIAATLERMTFETEDSIQDTVAGELGEGTYLTDSPSSSGHVYERGSYGPRTATNEESATWSFDLSLNGTVDRRKPIPSQFARWLRKRSAQLARAADRISDIPDNSDRRLIRKIVADPEHLAALVADGFEISHHGEVIQSGERDLIQERVSIQGSYRRKKGGAA